jgi:hypothetical protein
LEVPERLETINLYGFMDDPGTSTIYSRLFLVNLVISSEQRFQQLDANDDDQFMQGLKLRHVATNFDDLVSISQHWYDNLPVHRLCYYQSYYPLAEAMEEKLRQSMDVVPAAGNKVDAFGMTPFYILALSQTPNLSLFQVLAGACLK